VKVGQTISSRLKKKLENVLKGLQHTTLKIDSAAKFISYFINDILDYTVLSNDNINFVKNCAHFNIKEAVDEIVSILSDKMTMKRIKTNVRLFGFDG
jgi:hypothetical protein